MAKVIGIDLGTTNSVVSHADQAGVKVVLNRANERATPSVVGLHARSGEELIGTPAADNAERNPENTIYSIKRLMGRFFDDPNVQEVTKHYKYKVIKPDDGDDVRVLLGDMSRTPIEISAKILRKLKDDAQARLGDEVTHAVITVPAYFSINQRQATRTAGELAGLRVKKIIDEPTAAAMAFGVDLEPQAQRTVLVYDMGGGTFDISVLFIAGEMFIQMAIEGDMWLGGDDFDHAVIDYVLSEIRKEYGTDPSGDKRFMLQLKKAAEKAKKELSGVLSTSIVMSGTVPLPDGDRGDVDVELSRRDFEDLPITSNPIKFGGVEREVLQKWCEDLKINGKYQDGSVEFAPDTVRNRIKKSILLARKAMREADVTKEGIDHVLLVGGSTTIPLVQKMLEDEFGAERIMRNIDPMGCVAMGAGIAAERIPGIICENVLGTEPDGKEILCLEVNDLKATICRNVKCKAPLTAQKRCPSCNSVNEIEAEKCLSCAYPFKRIDAGNVTPKPIGILAAGDVYEVIVPKSTPYPTPEPVVMMFRTAENSQKAVLVPVYHAQVGEFSPDNIDQWIGAANIDLEGAHVPAETRVDVSVLIDRDGCMDIEAIIQDGSGLRQRVFIDPRIRSRTQPTKRPGEQVPPPVATPQWEGNLMWSILCAEIALRDYEWLLKDHRATQSLQQLITEARQALEQKNEAKGRQLEKDIDALLEDTLKGAMILLHAEMASLNQHLEPAQRSQLRSQIKEVVDGAKSNTSSSDLQQKMDRLGELIVACRSVGPIQDREDKGTHLKKYR